METTFYSNRNQPMFVPVALSAMGFLAGKWVAMRIESIDSNELFFISSEYIRPWAVFQLLVWLPKSQTPLYMTVTASAVERTSAGFSIAAQISSISTSAQALLDRFYLQAVAASQPSNGETLRLTQLLKRRVVVMLELALPGSVLAALKQHGVTVQAVPTIEEALKLAGHGGLDLVIGSVDGAGYDGIDLCRQLAELPAPPRSILITERGTAEDFERSLCAGATKVIARPCRNGMLAARIIDLLRAQYPATAQGKPPKAKDGHRPGEPARRSLSLLAQASGQVTAYWLSARSFFLTRSYARPSEITFL